MKAMRQAIAAFTAGGIDQWNLFRVNELWLGGLLD